MIKKKNCECIREKPQKYKDCEPYNAYYEETIKDHSDQQNGSI